ncbi:MAG: tetratricopeptide repeat protein [Gemmatimonadales bacterium]
MFSSGWRWTFIAVTLPALAAGGAAALWGGSGNGGDVAERERDPTVLEGAIAFFTERLAERPDDIIAAPALSDRYMMRFGRRRDIADVWRAESVLVAGLRAHPNYAPLLARRTSIHIARHEFPEALAVIRQALSIAPRRSMNGLLFDAYFEVGRYDSALAALHRMDPDAFGFLIRKTRLADQLGHSDLARYTMARACRPEGPTQAELRGWCAVRLADLAARIGRDRQAARGYQEALARDPGDLAALTGLADLAFKGNRCEDAERLLRRATRHPMGAEAHLVLSRIAALRGDRITAARERATFEQRARDPRYGRAYWSHLARHYAETRRADQALALARRDVEQRPGPEAYHTLGVVLLHAGQPEAARAAIERAMTWGPGDAELRYHAGIIYLAAGRPDDGRTFLLRALDDPAGIDPDYARIARRHLRGPGS